MPYKPPILGAALAVTTEMINKKEQATPHPYEEYFHQDRVTGVVNLYQINGSTIIRTIPFNKVTLATKDIS